MKVGCLYKYSLRWRKNCSPAGSYLQIRQIQLAFGVSVKENDQYLHRKVITFHSYPTLLYLWCPLPCLLGF